MDLNPLSKTQNPSIIDYTPLVISVFYWNKDIVMSCFLRDANQVIGFLFTTDVKSSMHALLHLSKALWSRKDDCMLSLQWVVSLWLYEITMHTRDLHLPCV